MEPHCRRSINCRSARSFRKFQLRRHFRLLKKGSRHRVAADGEIPYQLVPNEQAQYADLTGKNNSFGTIDYSISPPWVFIGQQVSLADIGLADAKPAEREARRTTAAANGLPELRRAARVDRA